MMRRILAIAPHCDDAELGLGGYMAKCREADDDVVIAIMAQGDASRDKTKLKYGHANPRAQEMLDAAEMLQVEVQFWNAARDGQFNETPRHDVVAKVQEMLKENEPDEVFIPLPSFHSDHVVAYEACISALRPRAGFTIPKRIFAYEYPGNSWGPQPPHDGKTYVSLSPQHLFKKIAALKCHKSQWVSDDRAALIGLDAVRALATMRGMEIGVQNAEMFYCIRQIL